MSCSDEVLKASRAVWNVGGVTSGAEVLLEADTHTRLRSAICGRVSNWDIRQPPVVPLGTERASMASSRRWRVVKSPPDQSRADGRTPSCAG